MSSIEAKLASMRDEIDRMWQVIDGQAKETAALERGIAATDYLMRNTQTQSAPVPDYSSGEEPAWCALRSWMRGRPKTDGEREAFRAGFAYGFDPGFPANPTRKQPLGALKEEWSKGFDEGAAAVTKRAEKAESECAAIAPPFATLADGAVVPLTNCTACGELGRADMAHYHVCRPSESEYAALRAEVERWKDMVHEMSPQVGVARLKLAAAESRLSAATELLHLARGYHDGVDAQIDAFLAAQPAVPTAELIRAASTQKPGVIDLGAALRESLRQPAATVVLDSAPAQRETLPRMTQPAAPGCDCSPEDLWECPAPGCPAKKPAAPARTEAEACQRTYPLDPLTAEDPCEDCGRDQRKHEIDDGLPF